MTINLKHLDILTQDITQEDFFKNFEAKLSLSTNFNEEMNLLVEACNFIFSMVHQNTLAFHNLSEDNDSKKVLMYSTLYKNINSTSFLNFTQIVFEKLRNVTLNNPDENFKDLLNINISPSAILLVFGVKNQYLLAIEHTIVNKAKIYLTEQFNNNSFFENYDFLNTKLNNITIPLFFDSEIHLDTIETKQLILDKIIIELNKSPVHFNFFTHSSKHNFYGKNSSEKSLFSFNLYTLSKGLNNSQQQISLAKLVIDYIFNNECSCLLQPVFQTHHPLLRNIPLHKFDLVDSDFNPTLESSQQFLNFDIFHYNDKFQKSPINKIFIDAFQNILDIDFSNFTEDEQIKFLFASYKYYFGFNSKYQQKFIDISNNIPNIESKFYALYQTIPQSTSDSNFAKNNDCIIQKTIPLFLTFNSFINKTDTLIETFFLLKSNNSNYHNTKNKIIKKFLGSNDLDESPFNRFLKYSFLQQKEHSFPLQKEYEQEIFTETLNIRNKQGVLFSEYLLQHKNELFFSSFNSNIRKLLDLKLFDNQTNSNNKNFSTMIKTLEKTDSLIFLPLFEHLQFSQKNEFLEDYIKSFILQSLHTDDDIKDILKLRFITSLLRYGENFNDIKTIEKILNTLSFIDEDFDKLTKKDVLESKHFSKIPKIDYDIPNLSLVLSFICCSTSTKDLEFSNLLEKSYNHAQSRFNVTLFKKDLIKINQLNTSNTKKRVNKF